MDAARARALLEPIAAHATQPKYRFVPILPINGQTLSGMPGAVCVCSVAYMHVCTGCAVGRYRHTHAEGLLLIYDNHQVGTGGTQAGCTAAFMTAIRLYPQACIPLLCVLCCCLLAR
jgi:hypothetical protein